MQGAAHHEADRLHAEVAQLRHALESRPVIDQALGMVMAMGPCDGESAWAVLVEVSQHTNTKLRTVAADLVATSRGARMPRPARTELAAALRTHRRDAGR